MTSRWSKMDDAKLFALFRKKTPNGNKPLIDTTDLNVKAVKAINEKYFANKIYKNFGPIYRKKARAWNLSQELSGSRKKQQENSSEDIGEEDEDEDDDDNFEADADIDNEEVDGLFTDAEEPLENIQASLSSLSISKKSAKMAARKDAASSAGVSTSEFSMDFKYPYLMYPYTSEGRNWVSIDFLVPTQSEERFRLAVRNNNILSLGTIVPKLFVSEDRVQLAHTNDKKFNHNTHKVTAQATLCEKVENAFENEHADVIIGKPQLVKLPIEVEEEIAKWECQLFSPDEHEFQEMVQADVYYNVLSVDLKSKDKKKKKKTKGRVRIIGSPSRVANDEQNQDQEPMLDDDGI